MAGHVITFYSYKGGTGRTMALANTAVVLARDRGKQVLTIDWDLEAPGLHRFLHDGETGERQGLLELFTSTSERLASAPLIASAKSAAARIWRECNLDGYIGPTQVPGLSVMRAGRMDESYPTRVSSFDWEQLYLDAPDVFSAFAHMLAERYDYVLVDSRTGISDAGGICTMLLPDRLVLVFTPNRQSLTGVLARAREATRYRSRSNDLRPLVVFPLASRVELSEEELRQEWRHGAVREEPPGPLMRDAYEDGSRMLTGDAYEDGYQPSFERLFREVYDLPACDMEQYFDEVQIQHAARFAYGEQIAVLDERASDRLSLSRSYLSFTRILADARGPWDYRRDTSAASSGQDQADIRVTLDHTIDLLAKASRQERGLELRVRILQAALVVVGLLTALLLNANVYTDQYATYAVGGGALLAAVAELLFRTWVPPDRHRSFAVAAARLAREERLYDACAGAYAATEAPTALLAERTDEILATIDDSTWALEHLRRQRPR